jgi:hypothetical protein
MTVRDLLTSALTHLNSNRIQIEEGKPLQPQIDKYTKTSPLPVLDPTPAAVNVAVALACLEDGHSLDEKLDDIFIPNQETLQR